MVVRRLQLSEDRTVKYKLLISIHRALDYFFCDRCPAEAFEEEEKSIVADLIDKFCPVQYFWDFLPEEPKEEDHPIYFPRCWLERRKVE